MPIHTASDERSRELICNFRSSIRPAGLVPHESDKRDRRTAVAGYERHRNSVERTHDLGHARDRSNFRQCPQYRFLRGWRIDVMLTEVEHDDILLCADGREVSVEDSCRLGGFGGGHVEVWRLQALFNSWHRDDARGHHHCPNDKHGPPVGSHQGRPSVEDAGPALTSPVLSKAPGRRRLLDGLVDVGRRRFCG